MANSLYAVVDQTNHVINLIVWDGVAALNVAPNILTLANSPNAQVGGTFSGGIFTAPSASPPNQGIIFAAVPADAGAVNIPNAPQPQAKLYCVLQPLANLSTLTLNFPASPLDGDDLFVISTKAITTVTPVFAAGQGKINIPASFALAAGVSQHITWSAQLASWFRL
jgi:hypothetical protein